MTNYNLYKVFYIVAQEKNITQASEKLFISQPAVSSSIKELENDLGEALFIRKNKGVELTTFGKMIFEKIKPILNSLDELDILSKKYNDLESGVIRIGSCSSNVNQILAEFLIPFTKKYPNIKVTMKRGSSDQLLQDLQKENLDIAFVDYTHKIDRNFNLIKRFNIKYQLIGSEAYKTKYPEKNIKMVDFPLHDLIVPNSNNKSREFIEKYFNNYGISLDSKYEVDNYILLYDFVKNGLGLAFVSASYYKENIDSGEVCLIYPEFFLPAREIVCVSNLFSTNNVLSNFLEFIK